MTTKVQAEFLAAGIISDQTQVSAADADHLLIFDASDNSLKKALVSTISGGGGSSAADDITAGDAAVTISTSSGNITIDNGSSDDDIIFKGTDGGSDITALTLDMSEAGKATFNGDVALGDSKKLLLGASDDLQIYHDGSNSIIADSGTGGLFLRGTDTVDIQSALGHNYLKSTINAGTQIYYNNSEKFATVSGGIKVTGNIENASGDLLIDAVDGILLDADDNGTVSFRDGGTRYCYIEKSSNDMVIKTTLSSAAIRLDSGQNVNLYAGGTHYAYLQNENSDFRIGPIIQDKDFIVRGNDGGTYIDGLTIDFSEAANVTVDSGNLLLGTAGKYIQVAGSSNNYWAIGSTGGNNSPGTASTTFGFHLWNGSAWDQELSLDASGNLTADGNVTAYSDERLKDNIQTLENGLDKVNQLRGITYTRKEKENIGVVAQEVEKILPEIVLTADDEIGTKSVDYSRLTAVLIEAVKELSAKLEKLENK